MWIVGCVDSGMCGVGCVDSGIVYGTPIAMYVTFTVCVNH